MEDLIAPPAWCSCHYWQINHAGGANYKKVKKEKEEEKGKKEREKGKKEREKRKEKKREENKI